MVWSTSVGSSMQVEGEREGQDFLGVELSSPLALVRKQGPPVRTPRQRRRPSQATVQQAMAKALKFSACMRSHGLPGFPDPKQDGPGISITGGRGIDVRSPQFQRAQNECRSLSPVR
jgi:hypothetical protein